MSFYRHHEVEGLRIVRQQNELSTEAFDLLTTLIVGQAVLRFSVVKGIGPRRVVYNVDGQEIDAALIRELRGIGGRSAIWPAHFSNLDDVPFYVTREGYAYVRQFADA